MAKFIYQGEESNLKVLADEVATHAELGRICSVRVVASEDRRPDTLRNGPVAEIIISVASGLVTAATYDAIRHLVARARDRGRIVDKPDEAEGATDA